MTKKMIEPGEVASLATASKGKKTQAGKRKPSSAPGPYVRKGINTFSGYQKEKVAKRLTKMVAILAALAKKRAHFNYITDLASEVAERLSNAADGKCSVSTLVRNDVYRAKLVEYLVNQKGEASAAASRRRRGRLDPQSEIEAINSQLEISNLKAEVERLHLYAAHLENRLAHKQEENVVTSSEMKDDLRTQLNICQANLALSNQAIELIIESFKGLLEEDMENKTIVDLSRRHGSTVVKASFLGPYFAFRKISNSIKGDRS